MLLLFMLLINNKKKTEIVNFNNDVKYIILYVSE